MDQTFIDIREAAGLIVGLLIFAILYFSVNR